MEDWLLGFMPDEVRNQGRVLVDRPEPVSSYLCLGCDHELAEDSGFSPEAMGYGHLSPEDSSLHREAAS